MMMKNKPETGLSKTHLPSQAISAILKSTMFTGIISDISSVRESEKSDEGILLTFDRPASWTDIALGESINTSGVCLTITAIREHAYDCFVVPETLSRSSFGKKFPKQVNLERALALNGRLDGHFVQGHVDGVGRVTAIDNSDGRRVHIAFDTENRDLIVEKGSITIDGVSLTVAAITDTIVVVALVPYTLAHTTLGQLQVEDLVNLEFDIIGKYVINSLRKTKQA
jgi:riboflavin synthase